MKLFFIFSQQSTGSKLLCSLFDSHPKIACPHESLNSGRGRDLVRYKEVAAGIAERNPEAEVIGLHGHYEYLHDEMHLAPETKIHLRRGDEVLNGVKLTLLNVDRADGIFELPIPQVLYNYRMVRKRNQEMALYTDYSVTYEWLTDGGQEIVSLPRNKDQTLLDMINVEYENLTTLVKKDRRNIPANLAEIYAGAENV